MKFYFCETCGKRLTEHDIAGGVARDKKLKGVFCKECGVGVTTMDSLPMTDQEALEVLKPTSSRGPSSGSAQRTDSRSGMKRARRTSGAVRPRSTSGRLGSDSERIPASKSNVAMYAAGAVGVVVVLGVVVLWSMGGSPKQTAKSKRKSPSVANRADGSPTDTPPTVDRPKTVPTPRKEEPREETPKERYERLVREGKIQKSTPAPTSPTPAPEQGNVTWSSGPWQSLFDGASLKGWRVAKGDWKVVNGLLEGHRLAKHKGAARIDSTAEYGNFEFEGMYRTPEGGHLEFRFWNSDVHFLPRTKPVKWRKIHVVARGDHISARVDGEELKHSRWRRQQKKGWLGFYLDDKGMIKLKDMRLRVLTPEAPKPVAAGEWQDLLMKDSLDGWRQERGKWRVQDGVLSKVPGARRSRVESRAEYGDFELQAKVRLVGRRSRLSEVQVRNLGWSFGFGYNNDQWQDLRIVARGSNVQATLDGRPLQADPGTNQQTLRGRIAFYANHNWLVEVKDLRLRTLSASTP